MDAHIWLWKLNERPWVVCFLESIWITAPYSSCSNRNLSKPPKPLETLETPGWTSPYIFNFRTSVFKNRENPFIFSWLQSGSKWGSYIEYLQEIGKYLERLKSLDQHTWRKKMNAWSRLGHPKYYIHILMYVYVSFALFLHICDEYHHIHTHTHLFQIY